MFKKILVPVDFSECSAEALMHAVSLRDAFQAQLEVVHAYDVPTFIPPHVVVMMGDVDAPLSEHAERHAKEQLQEFLAKLKLDGDKSIQSRVLLGPAASTVLEAAEDSHADMIVMGTHGRTGLSRLVMGSTAEKVLRGADCPVLTVRTEDTES